MDTKKKTTVSKTAPIKTVVPINKRHKEPVQTKAQVKEELLREMVRDGDVREVVFVKSKVPRSAYFADVYNKLPKVIAVWRTEEGELAGTAEPVKMNGAVAWIPKGVSVLVPDVVAKAFNRYLRIVKTVGEDIPNMRGGKGIKVEKGGEVLKNALDL